VTEGPDEQRLEAWRAFLSAQRALLDRLEDDLRREHGLPLSSYEVLLFLSRAPDDRMRMHELAESVLLTPSGLTRLVDRLAAEGLVTRQSCPTDRRGAFVVLTPAGRARLRRAAPSHLRGIQEHFGRHLTDADAETLSRALSRVAVAEGRAGPAAR
jgi:DNA-binding MarR family transcriptional regulator